MFRIRGTMKPSTFILFFPLLTLCCCESTEKSPSKTKLELPEDANLTAPELITKYGYPVEEHSVTTEDGYILTIHRIPHGKKSDEISNKVVFLMHGILCSSTDWIITGPGNALGYIMSDEGYDVWMGNTRGNTYSRNHTKLDPDQDKEFWEFSWHEMGTTDVPTMIDYVLNTTGQEQLYHVGHSQGTTSFYVMASMRPEYNKKIKAHFSLAPIAFVEHMTSPLIRILAFWPAPLEILMAMIGNGEFLPNAQFLSLAGAAFCSGSEITKTLCTNALFAITGFNWQEMNHTLLPLLMHHTPAGTSVKQIVHYSQEVYSGYFRQYDYGSRNYFHYGQLSPPKYNLGSISVPIYLLYSENDWLSHETDVEKLCKGLRKSCKRKVLIANGTYNHLDYLYGIHARDYVYSKIISFMDKI